MTNCPPSLVIMDEVTACDVNDVSLMDKWMECSIRFVVIIVEWEVEDSTSMVDLPLFFCLMFMVGMCYKKEAMD